MKGGNSASSAFFKKEEADYLDGIETFPKIRLRRLRQHAALRELISENRYLLRR